ncbi:MAG TPA: DUF4349 domain-containing protein [Chloroflexi bacterium]|nr:DUF4349 domain-containing protein [Chloroflexota bacterium]
MRNKLIVLSLVAVLLASCASGKSEVMDSFSPLASGATDNYAGDGKFSEEWDPSSKESLQVQETQIRMVIKNASLSIVVEEPAATMGLISSLAESLGGYVVSSNLYRVQMDSGLEIPQASITIRVPAEKLDQVLDEIKSGAGQVLSENVTGQDVTQEYTDLESRLRNLERAEEQLVEILEGSYETEDVLSVYNRLVDIREQIEVIKGQMQYYEQSAALSSISVNIQANEAVQPLRIGNWQPVGVAKKAIQALINTLKFLANALIWIGLYILPVALILFFPARWIWKGLKKLSQRKKERLAEKKNLKENG